MTINDLFDKYYFNKKDFINGTTFFHNLIDKYIENTNDTNTLEIGPSLLPSKTTIFLKKKFKNLYALDVDEQIKKNKLLDKPYIYIYDGIKMPFADNTFDIIVSDYVNEHIPNPTTHFNEIKRILKPNGIYCARTPNKLHYVSIMANILPFYFHQKIANKLRNINEKPDNVFPTCYKANCINFYNNLNGFKVIDIKQKELEPSYAKSSKVLFYLFMIYEVIVNRFDILSRFRANLFIVLRKI